MSYQFFVIARRYTALEAWALVPLCPGALAEERLLRLTDALRGEDDPRGALVQSIESPRPQYVAAIPAEQEELAGLPQEAVKETIRYLSQCICQGSPRLWRECHMLRFRRVQRDVPSSFISALLLQVAQPLHSEMRWLELTQQEGQNRCVELVPMFY